MQAPSKSRYVGLIEKNSSPAPDHSLAKKQAAEGVQGVDDEASPDISEGLNDEEVSSEEDESEQSEYDDDKEAHDEETRDTSLRVEQAAKIVLPDEADQQTTARKERKRKRKAENEGLEGNYFAQLAANESSEPAYKRTKAQESDPKTAAELDNDVSENEDEQVPTHESLGKAPNNLGLDKAARTVFIANVSSEAVSSKAAKKTLEKHLWSALDKEASPAQKIESIRFRSIAFSTGAMPKRAAYITGNLMGSTTRSTNAYAVFSTAAAARKIVTELNGSVVLDRHIRVDSVAHPSPTAHRRCVFVGNLGFVDDETVVSTNTDGETVEKKRNRVPSDIEEGLWRTFGKQGQVENVRVVRDPKTRVGKGFAYVQFYVSLDVNGLQRNISANSMKDANDVEAALLLDGKKFPPMLPRALRVTRAKDPRKTAQAHERARSKANKSDRTTGNMHYTRKITSEELATAGRAGKLLGRAAAAQQSRESAGGGRKRATELHAGLKPPERIVFEGKRASIKDGRPKDLKLGKKTKGRGGPPKNRSARRAAEWKKT